MMVFFELGAAFDDDAKSREAFAVACRAAQPQWKSRFVPRALPPMTSSASAAVSPHKSVNKDVAAVNKDVATPAVPPSTNSRDAASHGTAVDAGDSKATSPDDGATSVGLSTSGVGSCDTRADCGDDVGVVAPVHDGSEEKGVESDAAAVAVDGVGGGADVVVDADAEFARKLQEQYDREAEQVCWVVLGLRARLGSTSPLT